MLSEAPCIVYILLLSKADRTASFRNRFVYYIIDVIVTFWIYVRSRFQTLYLCFFFFFVNMHVYVKKITVENFWA